MCYFTLLKLLSTMHYLLINYSIIKNLQPARFQHLEAVFWSGSGGALSAEARGTCYQLQQGMCKWQLPWLVSTLVVQNLVRMIREILEHLPL